MGTASDYSSEYVPSVRLELRLRRSGFQAGYPSEKLWTHPKKYMADSLGLSANNEHKYRKIPNRFIGSKRPEGPSLHLQFLIYTLHEKVVTPFKIAEEA